jgi:D-alanyl-D-alanine dipeptidase
MRVIAACAAIAITLFAAPPSLRADNLPDGFVYLSDIAPHVRQDMRYAGKRNFTGSQVPGYRAAECILAEPAAQALSAVGDALAKQGLGLKVLDCYRPQKAVGHFVAWVRAGKGLDPDHHPRIDRRHLIRDGYIARRSGHSNGYTVDLRLTGAKGVDLEMGTPFDFFDPKAYTASRDVEASAAKRRRLLVAAMAKGGFVNYSREWWHFSFRDRPADAPAHDFDIVPRGN